jgi:hypothetical protein
LIDTANNVGGEIANGIDDIVSLKGKITRNVDADFRNFFRCAASMGYIASKTDNQLRTT